MFSLKSRLLLSRLALFLTPEHVDPFRVGEIMKAGVDLVVLPDTGDDAADANAVVAFRDQWVPTPMLIGTANTEAAQRSAADLVYVAKPSWWKRVDRPHEWSLLGRGAGDARTVAGGGGDFDFMVLGASDATSRVIHAAQENQPVFDLEAKPWFVRAHVSQASELLQQGVRRVALDSSILDEFGDEQAVQHVAGVTKQLADAWQDAGDYVRAATRM